MSHLISLQQLSNRTKYFISLLEL